MEVDNKVFFKYMSGTTFNESKILSVKLDRKIRPKSSFNGKYYFNSPVNLGSNLNFTNEGIINIPNTSIYGQNNVSIFFYSNIPISYDEWRIDSHFIHLKYTFTLSSNVQKIECFLDKKLVVTLTGPAVSIKFSSLFVSINDVKVNTTVFSQKNIFVGFDGSFNLSSWYISNMTMVDNYNDKIKSYLDTKMLLRKYMPLTKTIGTCINCDALLSDTNYGMKLAQNFNIVTTENHMKWQFIHPSELNYSFIETDLIVDFCKKNNISVRGHCLVWHEALPDWVWNIYKSKDYSRLKLVLLSHVETIVTRYKNTIKEYDVLNEIFSIDSTDKEGFRKKAEEDNFESPWFNAFGKQIYIDVLHKIKTIDPTIECWINDFGIDQKGFIPLLKKIIQFINYANNLGFGKLIDGLSFQCHNYDPKGDPSIASELKSNMQMVVNNCGVKVRISELDVDSASKNDSLFIDKLQVCLDLPECCSYGMWGFTDKYGSMNSPLVEKGSDNFKNPNYNCDISDSLILDEFYNEKKAYTKMFDKLS